MRTLRDAIDRWLGGAPEPRRGDAPAREVRCYHCGLLFDVPSAAMTSSCPRCSRHLGVRDLVIGGTHWAGALQTCGTLWIRPRGRAGGNVAVAGVGARIDGTLDGPLLAGGHVHVASSATVRGGIIAPALTVEDGARILGGQFRVPSDPIGAVDLDAMVAAARRPPGRRHAPANGTGVLIEAHGTPRRSAASAPAPRAGGGALRLVHEPDE
ncbi:MAG: polymer-forming cytoskeletal protein [Planctomycetota bacterium]